MLTTKVMTEKKVYKCFFLTLFIYILQSQLRLKWLTNHGFLVEI